MLRSDLPYIFVRILLDGAPSLGLARRKPTGDGHEFVWTVSFEEPFHREFLFAWLERRAGHWPFWGVIAAMQGAQALNMHIDGMVEEEASMGAPVMIQVYRAAAYLGCTEQDVLAFRARTECSGLFNDELDPLLGDRDMTFVDLGGLVRCMIEDAVVRSEEGGA